MRLWLLALALVATMAFCVSGLFVLLPDQYEGLSGYGYVVGLICLIALAGPIYRRLYW